MAREREAGKTTKQKQKSKRVRTDEVELIKEEQANAGDAENVQDVQDAEESKGASKDTKKSKKKNTPKQPRKGHRHLSAWEQVQIIGRKILNLDFTFDGLLPVNLIELERIIIYTILLFFSAYNGIQIPSRLDSSFRNISAKTGFSTGHSTFRVHFSGFTTFSQRVFVYGQFSRQYLPALPDEILAMDTNTKVNVTISERFGKRDAVQSFNVYNFNSDVDSEGRNSEIIPLVHLYDPHFSECNLTIDVNGNIAMYDTLQISEYSQNSQYTKTQFWYRFVFVVSSCVLAGWHYINGERGGRLKLAIIIAIATIICYGPTGIALFFEQKESMFVLDMIIGDVYSLFVYNIWIVIIVRSCRITSSTREVLRYIFTFANVVVGIIIVADSYSRAKAEYVNIHSWATTPMGGLDFAVMVIHGFLLFISYLMFILRRKMTSDGLGSAADVFQNWVDLPTYTFFVAQFCHIFDELLVRMKIINVMCVARQLRQFAEVSCLFLMTINKKETIEFIEMEESDNPLSDIKCEVIPDIDFGAQEEDA